MSDLLIKGMDLPKEGRVSLIAVFSDGDVKYIDRETFLSCRLPQKAIELPPHGELVQRSDIIELFDENNLSARKAVMKAPTVLEAST